MSDNIRWKFSFLNSLLNCARMTFDEMLLLARWSKFWTVTSRIFHHRSKTTIVFLPSSKENVDVSLKAKATTRRKNPFCSRAIKKEKPGRDLRKFPCTGMLILIPSQDHVTKRNEGLWGRECQFLCIPHHRLKKRFFGGRCERLMLCLHSSVYQGKH